MNTRTGVMVAGSVLLSSVAGMCAPAGAADSWQERVLFDPPQRQLLAESGGRVMIYDGMTEQQIATAMDNQFDRIGSMMFVRTVRTDAGGEVERDTVTGDILVVDDGC